VPSPVDSTMSACCTPFQPPCQRGGTICHPAGRSGGTVDAGDSKSPGRKAVWVRLPPSALPPQRHQATSPHGCAESRHGSGIDCWSFRAGVFCVAAQIRHNDRGAARPAAPQKGPCATMNLEHLLSPVDSGAAPANPIPRPAGVIGGNLATLPPPGTVFYGPPSGVKLPAELDALLGGLDQLQRDQAALLTEAVRLREQRPAVDLRDRQELGATIAQGRPEPEPELPAHDAEAERVQDRVTALDYAIADQVKRLHALIDERRDDWLGDAERAIAECQAEFDDAVKRLERTRAALAKVGEFSRWAAASPESPPGVTDTLIFSPGCEKAVGRHIAFESILGWLREDAAGLVARAPKPRTRLRLRRLVRRGDRIDAITDDPNTSWVRW
jgi:hypothetical protein